jgi:hypothetical protein
MEVPGWPPENIEELAKRFEDHYQDTRSCPAHRRAKRRRPSDGYGRA